MAKEFTIDKVLSLAPGLSARWVHEFGDTRALLNARFAGAPSGSFSVSSDTYDRDSCAFSLGVTGKFGTAWGFFLIYDVQMRSREFAHAVMTGARFSW
jgi:outer membrane autotransporter protein